MTHSLRPFAMALTLCALQSASACVINSDDGDDAADSSEGGSSPSTSNGSTDASSTNGTTASSTDASTTAGTTVGTTDDPTASTSLTTASDETTADSGPSDETQGESGVDVDPQDGAWEYQESGGTTNDCTFIANPSNGFGLYEVANTGGGGFTITPGDGTDPFTCSHSGGDFSCDERLSGTYDIGMGLGDATGNILVAIEGTLDSAVHMTAEQQGRIECEGADCATAEQVLGVTFPCEFTIPFTGDAQ